MGREMWEGVGRDGVGRKMWKGVDREMREGVGREM